MAGSVETLIAARALQGVGAALLVPGSLALIAASFPEKERGTAIGTWSAFSAMTTALGPVLGGWLIDNAGWRWAFFLNLPLAIVALLILFSRVPESHDPAASKSFDWLGATLAAASLGGIVFGLIEASRLGWNHPAVIAGVVGGIVGLAAFFVTEARSQAPMLPLSLFRSRRFAGTNLLTAGLYGGLTMALFVLPLNLIQVQGYSATGAGAAMLPLILTIFVFSRWSGGLLDRFGARLPLIAGPTMAAAGFALMARPGIGGTYWTTFFPAMVVLGMGMAVTITPLSATVMNAVDIGHAGLASGVNNAITRAAGLIAIAVMSAPLLYVFSGELERRFAGEGLRTDLVAQVREQRTMLASIEAPASASPSERITIDRTVRESFVAGFRYVVLAAAALALLSAATAAATIDP